MLIAIKGEKNSGKTTFIEELLKKLNCKVIVIKSSGHEFIDIDGKDTSRYRNAGAKASIIVAKNETAIFMESMNLSKAIDLAKKFNPDLIIVEGFKSIDNLKCKVIEMDKKPDIEEILREIEKEMRKEKIKIFVDGEKIPLNKFVEDLFYKVIKSMLSSLRGGEGKEIEIFISDS